MKVFLLMKTHFIAYFPTILWSIFWRFPFCSGMQCARALFRHKRTNFPTAALKQTRMRVEKADRSGLFSEKKYGYHIGVQPLLKFYRLIVLIFQIWLIFSQFCYNYWPKYTANVCRELQGLYREIGVQGFQIYEDCMYTCNPCNFEISTLLFPL